MHVNARQRKVSPALGTVDPKHRLDSGNQRRLAHRFRQVLVAARFEASDHLLGIGLGGHQDHRHEWQGGIGLQPTADFEPVHLRHHDIE